MKVIWLASWFPNRVNKTTGDFIERHAAAVAPFVDKLFIIVVVKDDAMPTGATEINKEQSGNQIIYKAYYGKSGWGSGFEKLLSSWKYFQLQKKIYAEIQETFGKPDIVHVHVAMKAGLFARWLKKKFALKYVVTEHWTGYNTLAKPNLYMMGNSFKRLNKLVLKEACVLLPVSEDLGNCINTNFVEKKYQVIYNVVNTKLFFYKPGVKKRYSFVHPSYMNYQKNPEGILLACKIVKDKGYDFELRMIGNKEEGLMKMARDMDLLETIVFFEAEVPYTAVAELMQQSSALLLFSRWENMPCVVLEALCCGLPVISTNVGGIAEVINSSNGILVENENVEQLADAMVKMIEGNIVYNHATIAANAAQQFNYTTIGKSYAAVYTTVLSGK